MIFNDELFKKEIDQLVDIGLKNGKLNRSTIIQLLSDKKAIDEYDSVIYYIKSAGVDLVDDDIEYENENENDRLDSEKTFLINKNSSLFYKPFDSTKINIAQKTISVEGIVTRLKYGEIDLFTKFQRKKGLWKDKIKSQLIESLMLRIPLPFFYFDGSYDNKWLVIDGLQRLSTIKEFFIDKTLKLTGLEYYTDYNGCTIDSLPRTYYRRMNETQLSLYIVQSGTPEEVKFNIFKRINTYGLKLENQEIRHALFQGKSTDLLKKIVDSDEFVKITGNSISDERMKASEVVLRYIAFNILGVEEYKFHNGKLDDFLIEAMKTLNKYDDNQLLDLEKKYLSTLKRVYNIFGKNTFRRIDSNTNRKNPFNIALYETWMINIGNLSSDEYKKLLLKKDELIYKFIDLLSDKTFNNDINSGKTTAVIRRITTINNLIRNFML